MTVSRRDVVTWLGVGAVVTGANALANAPEVPPQTPAAPPSPFRTLEPGLSLFGVWTVDAVHGPVDGAVAVHLRDGDHLFRLNVLKRDVAGASGVGESRSLAVYVCNGGGPTMEREGQAARALAAWLDHYEQTGLPVPQLKTLAQHAPAGANQL
jgi:hypothetical protein